MAKRKTVFGLPVGKKKASFAPWLAAGAGLVVPAVAAAARAAAAARGNGGGSGDSSSGSSGGGSGGPLGKLSEVAGSLGKVTDLAGKVSKVADAASEHSSTIGQAGAAVKQMVKLANGGSGGPRLSHLIEEHTDIAVPRSVAYNQWTQFEMFPSIVKGAESVEQKRRDTVQWTSKIGPSRRSWQGKITEQVPDERIAWESKGGLQLRGVVTFHSLDDELTRVLVEMEYDPRGPIEHIGNLLRVQRRRVRRDLRLFKHFVELRGEETGAWRNRIAKKDGASKPSGSSSKSSGSSSKPSGSSRRSSGSSSGSPSESPRRSSGSSSRSGGASRSSSARKAS